MNAKRFIDEFPFDAGPVGRIGVGKEGITLPGYARTAREASLAPRGIFFAY
jgi:hypothetical protein